MTVNLTKNKDALLAAWKDVLDDKTTTNWALFGYEGMTNDLKYISKGSNGIEELTEDLNSGKIMYAFLQVTDPKTSLPKNVLINWQGEGAQQVRKGVCANHIRDVSNFFKGAHVTINARTEEEVDPTIIIEKVSKSTGSVYKFNERTEHSNDSGPVGTAYKRTIPKQEINSLERDKFWEQQEEEEKQRQEEERRRTDAERKRLEAERQLRDSQETAKREAKILETAKSINQIRIAEKESFERSQVINNVPVEDIEKEELERRSRADTLRRQRSEEAQSLIAKRTVNARAVFEQNTAAGQLIQRRSSVQPRILSEQTTANRRSSEACPPTENHQAQYTPPSTADVIVKATEEIPIKECVKISSDIEKSENSSNIKNGFKNGHSRSEEEEPQDWEDEVKHEIPITIAPVEFQDTNLLPADELINGDLGLTAKALFDYQAADETEITFDPGDLITHIDQIDEGWWQGLGPDGTFGLFPANYVELIK